MLSKTFTLKIASLFTTVIFLSQCANVAQSEIQPNAALTQSKVSTPYTRPASAYLALAKNQAENEKQNWLLLAAGRFIEDGQWRDGLRVLSETTALTPEQSNTRHILLAKTDLMREQPKAAIARLANVREITSLAPFYQLQFYTVLARAYDAVNNPSFAVVERIKLEHLIPDEAGRANNRRLLWLTLTRLSSEELNTLAMEASDNSELQGWMKLALIAKNKARAESTYTQVEQWQSQFVRHPANALLPSPLASIKPKLFSAPQQVALLLPLSGPLAGPGGAIRDGFMAGASSNEGAKVRLYDTAKGDVRALYNQALNEGADYVVGPLSKNEVALVAGLPHPVPTILLNDVEGASSPNAYYFGLSPSNEARQVALKAQKNGYKRALVIAPAGAWGEEISAAFATQWHSVGGVVVDKLAYTPETDLNLAVRDVLHVTASQAREKQLKELLGQAIQSLPGRRQDIDMIFLLAYPSKARQIMPLLKYYFAGNIPVYATSAVYAGSPNVMKDKDLDGVVFSDMPWVFASPLTNRNWPEQLNSYNRLYALGLDSFALTSQLNQLLLFPAMGVNDKSGVLYLNQGQQIARIPAWGRFRGGIAQANG
ncbi:MAG: penicillin-binding protein activator [Tatlockia sp.]|jgi:hypothetical protein